jgi:hypothetical protein
VTLISETMADDELPSGTELCELCGSVVSFFYSQ